MSDDTLVEEICNDYGDNPACARVADPRYTMDYSDVVGEEEEPIIYWCSACGPIAKAQASAINEALATRPGFTEEFAGAIEHAQKSRTLT